jgi:hypothetical protein
LVITHLQILQTKRGITPFSTRLGVLRIIQSSIPLHNSMSREIDSLSITDSFDLTSKGRVAKPSKHERILNLSWDGL